MTQLIGAAEVARKIQELKTIGGKKIMRRAVAFGMRPIITIAKQKAPSKTGLLKSAIKKRVTKIGSGKIFVDPRIFAAKSATTNGEWLKINVKNAKGLKVKEVKAQVKAKLGPGTELRVPANYAHLVEFGTRTAPPHSFLRSALAEGRDAAFSEIVKSGQKSLKEMK